MSAAITDEASGPSAIPDMTVDGCNLFAPDAEEEHMIQDGQMEIANVNTKVSQTGWCFNSIVQ